MIVMNKNQIKWTIFAVSLFMFPTYFHLILDIAIWPVLYPLLGLLVPSVLRGNFQGLIYLLPSILFWSAFFYFISKWLSRKIINEEGERNLFLVIGLLIIVVILCVAPIYDNEPVLDEKFTVFVLYQQLF